LGASHFLERIVKHECDYGSETLTSSLFPSRIIL